MNRWTQALIVVVGAVTAAGVDVAINVDLLPQAHAATPVEFVFLGKGLTRVVDRDYSNVCYMSSNAMSCVPIR